MIHELHRVSVVYRAKKGARRGMDGIGKSNIYRFLFPFLPRSVLQPGGMGLKIGFCLPRDTSTRLLSLFRSRLFFSSLAAACFDFFTIFLRSFEIQAPKTSRARVSFEIKVQQPGATRDFVLSSRALEETETRSPWFLLFIGSVKKKKKNSTRWR